MLRLDPEYIIIVRHILAEQIPNIEVWAYGSRVTGISHEGSDLDLVIIDTKKTATSEQIFSLQEAFSASNVPILIDVLVWSDIPEHFKDEIKRNHIIIQTEQ